MKFNVPSASSSQKEFTTTKKTKSFERISPFELKPSNLSDLERDNLFRHISDIKSTYSSYKHYFVEQKLYKPTELVDFFWEITWFGYHLPFKTLADFLVQKYGSHPSKLMEIFIQHRGIESGKNITSLMLVFDKYFWLTSEDEFVITVGQRKVTGVAKPGWNLQKSKEMMAQGDDEYKFYWNAMSAHDEDSQEEDQDDDGQADRRQYSTPQAIQPKKKQKLLSQSDFTLLLEQKTVSKEQIENIFLTCFAGFSKDIRAEMKSMEFKVIDRIQQLRAMIKQEEATSKKDKDEDKQTRKRSSKKSADMKVQQPKEFLVKPEQLKMDSINNTSKVINIEEQAQHK